tara:strand:- start:33 stop:1688 length:1656 start_codon:yes stop_codon:yes gene_type:complete
MTTTTTRKKKRSDDVRDDAREEEEEDNCVEEEAFASSEETCFGGGSLLPSRRSQNLSRVHPTTIEKRRGRAVRVSAFANAATAVLEEMKGRRRGGGRKAMMMREHNDQKVEKRRKKVLEESTIESTSGNKSEEKTTKKKKKKQNCDDDDDDDDDEFPLTTIAEDFSVTQFSVSKSSKKKKNALREEREGTEEVSRSRPGRTTGGGHVTTTLSMIKERTKVMPPRLRREIDLASVAKHPVRAKRRGREDEDVERENVDERSNVILHVEVYDNCKPFVKYPTLNCEVLVHGDNRLTQLKDEIECLADFHQAAMNRGLVNDLKTKKKKKKKTKNENNKENTAKKTNNKYIGYKEANEANESGFFFIENVFYDDSRSENSVSLSKNIVDMSKKHFIRCPGMKLDDSDNENDAEEDEGKGSPVKQQKKKKLKPSNFTSRDMRETTFSDLEIVPGKAYLYRHQGACDHIVRFRDVRVAHMDTNIAKLSSKCYPIVISEARRVRKSCMCCEIHDATITAYGDEMAMCSPFFWCDSCFDIAHPTEKEKEETETYPYFFE